jgi:hypothetical protein
VAARRALIERDTRRWGDSLSLFRQNATVGRSGKDLALAFASSALLRGDDAAAGVVVIQQVDFGAEAAHAVPSGPRGRERLKSQGRMPAVTTGSRADVVVRARSSTIASTPP